VEAIDFSFLGVILRLTAPILLATIGALYADRAGVANVALEAYMLFGAFFAVVGSFFMGSSLIGVLFAILIGMLISSFFSLLTLKLEGNEIIVGMALIFLSMGFTKFLLNLIFNTSGSFISPEIVGLPKIDIPFLSSIPIIGELFKGQTLIVYFAFLSVLATHIIISKTSFGMRIIACGENPEAASTIGIDVNKTRFIANLITGGLCGLAGAQISLGFLNMFSENMTAGQGFIALAAVIFAKAIPVRVLFICLIFGTANAISNQLQTADMPTEIVLMTPYLIVVVALCFNFSRFSFRKKMKSMVSTDA